MQKIKIALCDKDKFYCERFAAYMMNHKAQEIELNIYSTIEQFTGDEKMGNFDLVIAGSGFEEFSSDVNIMYLSDLCGNQAAEEAMWEKDTIPQKKIVTKYQPMEQLLHEIYVQAGMTKREPVGVQVATHGKVIGVVSPECHEMQELFSVMHAVNLGREQKVLYFNFLEFSGFRELFGQTGNFDFTDVVLKLRSGELTTEYFWNCVYEMSGISVILPFENPENIRQIGRQEWEQFIDFMEQNTDFEVLVVDFGVNMPELADCMSRCDELLLIGREGYFYECRDKHFYEWLEKTGHQAVAEKITKSMCHIRLKIFMAVEMSSSSYSGVNLVILSEDGRRSWMSSKCLECVL